MSNFNRIKVGKQTLEDAILDLSSLKAVKDDNRIIKEDVVKALATGDVEALRKISTAFKNISGIYERMCNYFAFLYRYDWYVVPEIYDNNYNQEKILTDFNAILNYLDNSYIRKICGDIALEVILNGAYYAYVIDTADRFVLQTLPINYCRSRYSIAGRPAVEFNMKFFDDQFKDPAYRMNVLKLFPDEFSKGYIAYKQGKLTPEHSGERQGGWYLLSPDRTIKFNFNNSDIPLFVNAIPAIIDLDSAQALDRRKQMQKLLKIIVQKLPMDKNGDLIFDVDEARDIHGNAVQMLSNAVGVDVLTTFADIDSIDMSDRNTSTTTDDLEKVERAVFNAFGTSQNLFNTSGNMSLEKSILNDESVVRNLLLQFQNFFDTILQAKGAAKRKKYRFKLYMLETTQYNYKDLSKMYKEQVQLGYSKMLPQIALGHSQSSIINTAHFENEVLHLSEIMIPPLMSSTLNGEDILGKRGSNKSDGIQEEKAAGRPEKPNDQKSDKTIANKESQN